MDNIMLLTVGICCHACFFNVYTKVNISYIFFK